MSLVIAAFLSLLSRLPKAFPQPQGPGLSRVSAWGQGANVRQLLRFPF